jgi:hypothetical protein
LAVLLDIAFALRARSANGRTSAGSAAFCRQPQNDVAVTLARTAQALETGDHNRLKPYVALALRVGRVLVADIADRERAGNRLERLDADGDEDLARLHGRDEGVRCRQFHRHVAAIAPARTI